jgi:hypothetical protein
MSSTLTNLTAATTWSGTDLFYALVSSNSRKIAASNFLVKEAANTLSLVNSTNGQSLRIYNTFTDSSNYERLACYGAFSGVAYFAFEVQTAGSGQDNIDLAFIPAGTGGINMAAKTQIAGNITLPAGGSTSMCVVFGNQAGVTNFGIYAGSGVPTVSAGQGSLYLRNDGAGTSSRMYVNSSSGSGTSWTAITTAA